MASSLARGICPQVQRPCASLLVQQVRHNTFKHFPGIRSVASRKRMFELQEIVDKVVGVQRVCKRPIPEEEKWHVNAPDPTPDEARQENRPLIYLCNWSVKLVGPTLQETDVVKFVVSMPMNKFEIEQYLTLLYGLDIIRVRTAIYHGAVVADQPGSRRVAFEPYFKVAYVTLRDTMFKFPPPHKMFPEHFEEDSPIPAPALRIGSDVKMGIYNYDYRAHVYEAQRKMEDHYLEEPPKGVR
ncbi:uncharacterized protein LOC135806437 [Sycon ciliatum]|uniref:uncharacterized protein LOC135806437 n=1 Tax=Sycon ciliatum TaxID=27933 RepID=UPI0020AA36F0|eukprot:scpid97191/ scgid11780/ 